MAGEIERLVAKIEGDMSGLRAEVGKARALMDRHAKQMNSTLAGMDKRFAALGAVAKQALGVVSVGAFVQLTRSAMNYADTLADVSAQTGLHVEALQEIRFAAAQVGLEQASVDKALTKFTINLGQATTIGGEYSRTFQQLGVATHDASGKMRSSEDVMNDVFEALSKVEDVALRNALAYKIFGKEAGPAFAQFAAQGTAAINAQREAARKMGAVMDKEMIDRADKAADEMTALAQVIRTQAMVAVADLSPLLVQLAGGFARVVREVGEMGRGLQYAFGLIETSPLENEIKKIEQQATNLRAKIEQATSDGIAFDEEGAVTTIDALNQRLRGTLDLLEMTKQKQRDLLLGPDKPVVPAQPGAGGGLEIDPEEARKARERELKQIAADYERALGLTQSRFEREQEEYDKAVGAIQAAVDARVTSEEAAAEEFARLDAARVESFRKAMDEINAEHATALAEQTENEKKAREIVQREQQARFETTSKVLGDLSALMGTHSRKQFEIGKAAALAQATVDTIAGAAKAFKDYSWPYSLIVAGAVAAAGYARVQAIRNTKFGGSSVNVGVGGGLSVGTERAGGGGPTAGQTSNIYISLKGQELFTGDAVRQLIERISEAQGDGSRIRVVS